MRTNKLPAVAAGYSVVKLKLRSQLVVTIVTNLYRYKDQIFRQMITVRFVLRTLTRAVMIYDSKRDLS